MAHLLRLAGGDARRALTALEAGGRGGAGDRRRRPLDVGRRSRRAVDRAALRYDRDGDQHYDVISAFIKSVRGSDVDAALHYLARMVEAGEDPRFIARRLVILGRRRTSASPTRPRCCGRRRRRGGGADRHARGPDQPGPGGHPPDARAEVERRVPGRRRARIADVRAGLAGPVPPHLRDAHYAGATRSATARATVYPHDQPGGVAPQQYPPDVVLPAATYYRPTRHGAEARLADLWDKLRALVRGTP